MAGNTAEQMDFTPAWADLDDMFNDPSEEPVPLDAIFDPMVARQAEAGSDLKEPCDEAQELLEQWSRDDDGFDYLPNWRAAVARRQPGLCAVEQAAEDSPGGDAAEGAAGEQDAVDSPEGEAPDLMNDAEVLGVGDDALTDFLKSEATFLLGEMWGARDRRNTQDGHWKQVALPWVSWLIGQPGDKNTPAWGLTRHPVGKDKAGASIVLGSSIGGARKAKAMDTMSAIGLDIDSGAKLDDVLDILEKMDILCFVYTSFNHMKRGIELKRDEVLRKLQIKRDPTVEEVRKFLHEFDKNRYETDFIAACTIKDLKHQTTEGVKIVLDTPPLEKFRLIFPLAEAVKIIDLAETHQAALDQWEDKITGLARNMLGVHFDTSCTDPSRLFYTARHPKGDDNWYAAVLQGRPLSFDEIEPYKKSAYTSKREDNVFTQAAGMDDDEDRPPQCVTPTGKSLNDWHRSAKDRFMIAELIETTCPDKVRHSGGEAQGAIHCECPFEHEHSSEGGTATMAVNSIDSQSEYWAWWCHHDACQGRHKLQFLEEALRAGWFEEDVLTDIDQGFLLEAWDDEEDPLAPLTGDLGDTEKTPEERAEAFTRGNSELEIKKFFNELIRAGVDQTVKGNVVEAVAKNTSLTKPETKKIWRELAKDAKREEREGAAVFLTDGGFRDHCATAAEYMFDQGAQPTLFHSNGRIGEIRADEQGALKIESVDQLRFKARMEDRIDFFADECAVEAPRGIVNNVYQRDKTGYPPLHKIIEAPVFDPDKRLITEPGYHPSGFFYQPQDGVVVPRVSAHPSQEEVCAAVDDLVDILGDFMLDAMSRAELEEAVREGRPVPSFCHTLSFGLTALCRAFIDGPTPGHLARKMQPRTGATKLLSNVSRMATLAHARPQSLPDSKAEVQKTVVASFDSGQQYTFFDNLPDSSKVDFGELASAMTAYPYYTGRRLGVTGMVDAKVNNTWGFTGNKTVLSPELSARMLLITLDPQVERPEERTGFKYDIDAHVARNGGKYLHSFLTIVQHWIAEGCKEWSGRPLGGFERHSAIIGGILEAAGIHGFLANRDVLRSTVNTASPEDDLMDALIDLHHATPATKEGTLFRVWAADAAPQWEGLGSDRKAHALAKHRVVSIKETLEAESIALKGTGYAQLEDGGVIYPDRAKASLRQFIGGIVGQVRERGSDREEVEAKQGRYIFELAGKDRNSNLYRLKRLDLT